MTTRKTTTKNAKKAPVKADAAVKKPLTKTVAKKRETLVSLRAHVDSIENRLKQADSLTQASIKALRLSYEQLSGENNQATVAGHIEVLAHRLNDMIAQTRKDVAHDLQVVLEDPRLDTISTALTSANQRLTHAESEQAIAINAINEQIADLAIAVDERMARETQAREEGHAVLTQRLETIETSSSEAIKMIGDKVATVSEEMSRRAEDNVETITQTSAKNALTQQQKLEEHKSEIGRRIEGIEDDQRNSIPSMERRIVTLSTRLEALENSGAFDAAGAETMNIINDQLPPLPIDDGESHVQNVQNVPQNDAFTSVEIVQKEAIENPYAQDTFTQDAANNTVVAMQEVQPNPQQFVNLQMEQQQQVQQQQVAMNYVPQAFDTSAAVQQQAPQMMETSNNPYTDRISGQAEHFIPEPFKGPVASIGASAPLSPEALRADPFMADLPPMPQANETFPSFRDDQQSMENARPGAETGKSKRKSKLSRKEKKARRSAKLENLSGEQVVSSVGGGLPPKKSNVKKIALLAGVALVSALAVKTMMPKSSNDGAPNIAVNSQPDRILASAGENGTSLPSLGLETQQSNQYDNIGTVEATGNFNQESRETVDLGPDVNGQPSTEKMTLKAAVKAGNPIAQFQAGLIHLEQGREAEAVRLIRLAATQGQPAAQYRLAKMYEVGIGVGENQQEAMGLLELAARAGNTVAMHDVGHFYVTGVAGGGQDMNKALAWFEMAAKHGFLDSQFNLGVLYQGAEGVSQDISKSYMWYSIAAQQGDKVAAQRREILSRELPADQLAAAEARVKAFAPKRQNNAANGVFKDLPWAPARKLTSKVNESVKQAQEMLSGLGYGVGAPDGAMGPKTRNAIISFERANGLPETGRVNAALLDRLNLALGV